MNVIFLTQSETLKIFYDLMLLLKEPLQLDKVGFVLSDSNYYAQFRKEVPEIESGACTLVKEWEVMAKAETTPPNLEKLQEIQNTLGVPSLWNAVMSDRRLIWGSKFTFRQDYKTIFNHQEVLSILTENFTAMEELFDQVQPDLVVGYICTTVSEYASFLMAKARNIHYINLRPTRIDNYMAYGTHVLEPADLVQEVYERYQKGEQDHWLEKAQTYIQNFREKQVLYSGAYKISDPHANVMKVSSHRLMKFVNVARLQRLLKKAWKEEYYYRVNGVKCDRHVPGFVIPFLYQTFLNPWLLRRVNSHFANRYATLEEIEKMDYVFFPMHKEPEMQLLVNSKPFTNQIEVIRNIAYSLPVGMSLVLKEHPTYRAKRPLNYYKKLEDIINVRIANPTIEARDMIRHSKCVATIAGSVGLEAALLGKPTLIFGHTPTQMLPTSMIRKVVNLEQIGHILSDLMQNYHLDEEALKHYVAAHMRQSAPVNWYTTLLNKSSDPSVKSLEERNKHMHLLADYTIATFEHLQNREV